MCSRRRDRSSLVVAALVIASGCNELLGIDPTVTDTDGDGVVDPDDNCPLDYNPPQLDRDNDGRGDPCSPCVAIGLDLDGDAIDDACDGCIGPGPNGLDVDQDAIDDGCDACTIGDGSDGDGDGIEDGCDTCPSGRAHDEDGDGHHDACDNCPSVANPDQEDKIDEPADGIGDACDSFTSRETIALFDPFDLPDPARWPSSAPEFMQGDDEIVVERTLTAERLSTAIVRHPAVVETRLGRLAAGAAGVVVRSTANQSAFTCTVGPDGVVTASVELGVPVITQTASGADVSGAVLITLLTKPGADGYDLHCEATGADRQLVKTPDIPGQPANSLVVGLKTTGADATFEYVWARFTP